MLKALGEADIDMITDLVTHVVVEGVIPVEWEISAIENCYKWKGKSLERVNYRELKLTDQIRF